MKIKITEIHPSCSWYNKPGFVGEIFESTEEIKECCTTAGWINETGWFDGTINDGKESWPIYGFKYIEVPEPSDAWFWKQNFEIKDDKKYNEAVEKLNRIVKENEPSQMSELGGTVNKYTTDPVQAIKFAAIAVSKAVGYTVEAAKEEDKFNKAFDNFNKVVYPKKLTWIQKIRGYDDLQARCNSAEAMRDHYGAVCKAQREVIKDRTRDVNYYESIATEKARELELMEKVADNWQQKAIDANNTFESLLWLNDTIGKRLKFSTHGMKFEIIVGDPFTICGMHFRGWNTDYHGVARRNVKDQMNWKNAAIQSVKNLCREWVGDRDIQASIFEALFAAHPELK